MFSFQSIRALSRGLGRVVLSHQTGVRIPVALPLLFPSISLIIPSFEAFVFSAPIP